MALVVGFVGRLALLLAGLGLCGVAQAGADRTTPTIQDVPPLPPPTGPFQIGRVTIHLTDVSRVERAAPDGTPRELMVDVWYPAEPTTAPRAAAYFDGAAFSQPRSDERLKSYLRTAYDAIKAGCVPTFAFEGVPFARSATRTPLLIFSHGGGEARETYTAQLGDLASHGYVVAAITHSYESVLAVFPDGRHALLRPDLWPQATSTTIPGLPPTEEANPDKLRWLAEDIRFVLSELSRHSRTPSGILPFAEKIDLTRVGAFGHSMGGQAAANACQNDQRLRACLNQDGLSAFAPYYLDVEGWGMDQPFMLMVRAPRTDSPGDEDLAAMKVSRTQFDEILRQLRARQDATLRNTGKGSYRLLLARETTTHADFGDLPLLQSPTRPEADTRAQVLSEIRRYTRAFFDKYLKQQKTPLLDDRVSGEYVETVESFPPAERPKRRR